MGMDLTGINNYNEYYTNHYFASIFEENAEETISAWRNKAKESAEVRTPWSLMRESARSYYSIHEKYLRSRGDNERLTMINDMADQYLESLGFPKANSALVEVNENINAPVYLEVNKANGAPLLWVMLAHVKERDINIMQGCCFNSSDLEDNNGESISVTNLENEELASKIFYAMAEPPRWILFIGLDQIALVDRNKWNEKRYLQFDLEEIFSRREETTFQAMSVLLHKENLCPEEGNSLLDRLDENSHRHSASVSQDLKYALRESIERLGNEVLYDLSHRLGRNWDTDPVDASQLTIECLRYMYRMLFMLFIEARPELGYAPMKAQAYVQGYSLESLRDIADNIQDEISEVGEGYYLHETMSKLFELIYNGYPETEESLKELSGRESLHDVFVIDPLKAHIFDPEFTPMITKAKIRNSIMLKIIDLMSITRPSGRRNERRGRISYAALGINQMGAVYEALLSYRGFIAEETLYEVKRKGDHFDEMDVGYFVPEYELDNYTEDERVRYESGVNKGKLRKYEKGTFIYRLAGREREKSASYYTPEVLTKCLVKYALKELLEGKTADEILQLTICEPAMGSAAFLNEAINQLAEAYLDKKQKELGETISYEIRYQELQRVKMYIADRNVYGVDLNPVAVELAEVSLWLNTIYKGAYVPWFGLQLVNGNSLIGARKQCYRIEELQARRAPGRWYDNAPERIMPCDKRMPRKQVYHFLMGDPGMANYTDRVIKSLASDKIQAIKNWNRNFIAPYTDEDIQALLRISTVIDDLWTKQIALRRTIDERTTDALSVYGQEEDMNVSYTTIREKDTIYKHLYLSEDMKNAGPYARLKFAMDYWCALWFWPIDKADLLPSRSEFIFDMSLILEGGIVSVTKQQNVQMSLFPSERDEMAYEVLDLFKDLAEVDIPALCERNPRLKLAKEIAEVNKFMHWELEFSDLFDQRGGFDLVIGNPPWIKMTWSEQAMLADRQPLFAIKDFSATQTMHKRSETLVNNETYKMYFSEYESMSGMQSFLGSNQNYPDIKGVINLYKCFLPQAWEFCNSKGVAAFIHPDGVYDDPKGGVLREKIYPRLRLHFQFINELKLFAEVHHNTVFSLNVYCNEACSTFDSISNLFDVTTIEQCYDDVIVGEIPGIKDEKNSWNINGHPGRVVRIGKSELKVFAKIFDGTDNWKQARLPALHAQKLLEILISIAEQKKTIADLRENLFTTEMWNETMAQKNNIIERKTQFPKSNLEVIYSGSHIGNANPLFKTSKVICRLVSDFECVDLSYIPDDYFQRVNYTPNNIDEYINNIPLLPWGKRYTSEYRLIARRMLDLKGEKTLMCAIIPPGTGHINSLFGLVINDPIQTVLLAGLFASIPYDYIIKTIGKDNLYANNTNILPIINSKYDLSIICRVLRLNCVSKQYAELWLKCWKEEYIYEEWSNNDRRLGKSYITLSKNWEHDTAFRTDLERRQALVEIDVLSALALGLTLEQLLLLYRSTFFAAQQNESNTWYDRNGRIVFTSSRSLVGIGFSTAEWREIKDAKSGTFTRTITDDTMPGGPLERTIEYVAPFDRCDREQDYETAWAFFEKRFKDK